MKLYLGWVLRGLAMGAANIIPGVSGGTIAFITGIYERLINALKSFDVEALKLLLSAKWYELADKIDLKFLLAIFLGVAVGIIGLAKVLEYAFQNYEALTLAFFFGLIIASILGVGKQIEVFNLTTLLGLITGITLAAGIAFLPPAEANSNFLYLTLCGMIAISSMILPGLSGSYILLLMGNYVLVLGAINNIDVSILLPVAIGCILGVVTFSRLLSYLFANYKDLTISLLTGFVAGSLAIIWPWKITNYVTLDGGKEKAIGYEWFIPELNTDFYIAIFLMAIGFLSVWMMEKYTTNEKAKDS